MSHAITKKQLGVLIILAGLGADAVLLIGGRLGVGAWSGIGPVERVLLLAGLGFALLGVPLLRLGNVPAAAGHEPRYGAVARSEIGHKGMSWIGRAVAALALLVFLAYLGVYVAYAADLFGWPYDYDQGESFELYDAVLHSQGEWPYRDSSVYPFYSSNYPPVFHILNILFFPLFGKTLLSGRVLSFVITLLTAFAIGWTVYRRTGGVFIPLMSGLAYTASNFVYHIGPLCRQHLTMVFFETLCVFFIADAENPRHGKCNLVLGLICLLLAGYAKQLAVFTAAAVFGYLLLRNPRRALVSVIVFGALFGLVFLGINRATDGHWWINTIAANVNEFVFPQLIALTRAWLKVHTVFIVLAVGMVIYEAYIGSLSVYALWFVCVLGTGVMSGKWGAGEAYWVSSVAAAIVLSGFALGKLRDSITQQRRQWQGYLAILIPLLFLVQSTRMLHLPTDGPFWGPVARVLGVAGKSVYADYPYYDSVGYTQVGHFMLPRDYDGGARIMAYVRGTDLPVFSEEAAFTMLAGKPVVTNPTQLLNLYNNGLLDTRELEAMIRREAFGLVIMRAQFYPPPVLAAIGQHYGLVEHVPMNGFNYIIMQPLGQPELNGSQ
ncbi:MAG TPA: glycosyltransferase family 39 protein [Anaerolineae bacterium]|nr:glycosyltransferase family 39 protein [Anaerolineae bacterium]HQK15003.1 glycosyltransferase family 39 protein [Anaerolineae bacterium]